MSPITLLFLASTALGGQRATATVKPADLVIPDPWRPADTAPLTDEQLAACTEGGALAKGSEGTALAVIEVRPDGIQYAGKAAGTLEDTGPLRDALVRTTTDLQIVDALGCATPAVETPRVLVALDGSLSWLDASRVLDAVGHGGFAHVDLRVDASPGQVPDARILADGAQVAVTMDTAGRTITGLGDPIPLEGHDPKMLQTVLNRLKPNAAGQNQLVLRPGPTLPWSLVADTLGAIAFDAGGKPVVPRILLAPPLDPPAEDAPEAPAGTAGLPSPVLPEGGAAVFRTELLPMPATFAGQPVLGAQDRKAIRKVVRKDLHEIRWCYDQHAKGKKAFTGTVVVRATTDASGAVQDVSAGGTLGDKAVNDCVIGRFKGLAFPASAPGGTVIGYGFHFAPEAE